MSDHAERIAEIDRQLARLKSGEIAVDEFREWLVLNTWGWYSVEGDALSRKIAEAHSAGNVSANNICPVCGYLGCLIEDWHICPCCGTEFGYDDAGRTHAELRRRWIDGGMKWWSKRMDGAK